MQEQPSSETARTDGRSARAERTRDAVVEAVLSLIEEGDLRPTGPRIAERAGVSLRSVYQHFDDLEALFSRAADLHNERMQRLARPVPTEGPLADRLNAFVIERTRLLEATSPVARAAALVQPFSPEVASRMRGARRRGSAEIEAVFAPELAGFETRDREELLAALNAICDWPTWENLRAYQGLSETGARRTLARVLGALLKAEDLSPGPFPAREGETDQGKETVRNGEATTGNGEMMMDGETKDGFGS